jgi:NAD(P)-dependent dehydrogenase (short-subunit alcohol dehydrogenase family)
MSGKRWFITGVSSGFGRLLAETALARGDSVVGTLRNPEQAEAFTALAPGRAHAIMLDVTDRNAGYGLAGVLEEMQDDEIDHAVETNLMGTIYVTRAALPALRESKGHIVNFSSMAGMIGLPGMATYCAAKHGVEGFSEALSIEMAPFGVRVTVVEPGGFRTNFFKGSERIARKPLAIYDETPGGMTRSGLSGAGDYMPGNPEKAVQAILKAIEAPTPPLRLVLGADALGSIRSKLDGVIANLSEWENVTLSTGFDAG